jgi:hypothetical protein
LADLTPRDLLERIVTVCANSPIVTAYAVRILDLLDSPDAHHLCNPVSFETFLAEFKCSAFLQRSRDLKKRERPGHGNCIITSVDILNPVQVSAAGMDPKVLKREFGRDITFWCGGCDSQRVLPFGTPEAVADEVKRRIDNLAPGGGFVFSPIHNVQTGVPPENVVAMFKTARQADGRR